MSDDKRRERLRYRSWHRGTHEMDLLLGSFADAHLHAFTPDQLDVYEALLEQQEPDLYSWIIGTVAPLEAESEVLRLLRQHRLTMSGVR